jgi:hypothetical protein
MWRPHPPAQKFFKDNNLEIPDTDDIAQIEAEASTRSRFSSTRAVP